MKATKFLKQARKTMIERGKIYDSKDGERSMGKIVTAFNAITGKDLKESQGWLFMSILKSVRQESSLTYHEDSALDNVAYSSLLAESLSNEK